MNQAQFDQTHLQLAFDTTRSLVEEGKIPCAVLAVATHDTVVRCESFSGDERVSTDTLFPLASITKAVLAVSALQLVQTGKFILTQPITQYVPDFQVPGVTAWHLLTHSSGLNEHMRFEEMLRERTTAEEFLRRAYRSELKFTPGSRVEYNTLGFYLLAQLIGELSGLPCPAYQHTALFAPLSMNDTTYDPLATAPARTVLLRSHEPILLTREAWTRYEISLTPPAFDLWSTAADMIVLGQALLNDLVRHTGKILAPAYVELMTQDHTAGLMEVVNGHPQPAHRGLGWGKRKQGLPGSSRVFQHGGGSGGELWIDPEWDVIYVFLSNEEGRDWPYQLLPLQTVYNALRV